MTAGHPHLKRDIETLYDAFLTLQNEDDVRNFLKDLCTGQEIRAFAERFRVAQLLDQGQLSYREISDQTGVSTTTVTRVAKYLRDEPHQGYRRVLDRMKEPKEPK